MPRSWPNLQVQTATIYVGSASRCRHVDVALAHMVASSPKFGILKLHPSSAHLMNKGNSCHFTEELEFVATRRTTKARRQPWNKGVKAGQRHPFSRSDVGRIKKLLAKRGDATPPASVQAVTNSLPRRSASATAIENLRSWAS